MNTPVASHSAALRELLVGVEMDAAHDPSGPAKIAALNAAIASLAALASPAIPAGLDLGLVARMLEDYDELCGELSDSDPTPRYSRAAIEQQVNLLREAENATGEARTVNRSGSGEGGLPEPDYLCAGTYQPAYSADQMLAYGEQCRLASSAPQGEVLSGCVNGYLPRQQAIEVKADAPLPAWLTSQPGLRVFLSTTPPPAPTTDHIVDANKKVAPAAEQGYEATYATAERLAKSAATEKCDFCGVNPGEFHAYDCTALDTTEQPGSAVQGEANGKLVGWWNGITDNGERDGIGWSVRWGADAQDSNHDIPLYDGFNPLHYTTPPPAPSETYRAGYAQGVEDSRKAECACTRTVVLPPAPAASHADLLGPPIPQAEVDALRAVGAPGFDYDDAPAAEQGDTVAFDFCWLVELFRPYGGNSLGRYYTGREADPTATDPHKAQRYATLKDAQYAATLLMPGPDEEWRGVEHGFQRPATQSEARATEQREVACRTLSRATLLRIAGDYDEWGNASMAAYLREVAIPPPEGTEALGRFRHHPDPVIDFEVEVQWLEGRLFDARHGVGKPGEQPETVAQVAEAIGRAMQFRVGGDDSAVRAKQALRELEREASLEAHPEARGVEGMVLVPKEPPAAVIESICAAHGGGVWPDGYAPLAQAHRRADAIESYAAVVGQGECEHCYHDGVYSTDGRGPYDCYACGKKAAAPNPVRAEQPVMLTDDMNDIVLRGLENGDLDIPAEQPEGKGASGNWIRGLDANGMPIAPAPAAPVERSDKQQHMNAVKVLWSLGWRWNGEWVAPAAPGAAVGVDE